MAITQAMGERALASLTEGQACQGLSMDRPPSKGPGQPSQSPGPGVPQRGAGETGLQGATRTGSYLEGHRAVVWGWPEGDCY